MLDLQDHLEEHKVDVEVEGVSLSIRYPCEPIDPRRLRLFALELEEVVLRPPSLEVVLVDLLELVEVLVEMDSLSLNSMIDFVHVAADTLRLLPDRS